MHDTIDTYEALESNYRLWVEAGDDPSLDDLLQFYPEWKDRILNGFPRLREEVYAASAAGQGVEFEQVKSEYQRLLKNGVAPKIEDFVRRFPRFEDEIRDVFPAVQVMEKLKGEQSSWPSTGDTLGQYQLFREIGRGGAGVVFEAEHRETKQSCAVKVFDRVDSPFASRFRLEASTLAKLDHPNITPCYDSGEQDGTPFLAMKLIRGVSLSEVIALAKKRSDEGVPPYPIGDLKAIAMLGADTASALHYAHERGILHRDVKPANLILNFDGNIWLTDFGCAKDVDPQSPQTETGFVIGTLKYMAPEQRDGEPVPQSDIYGLGLTLKELAKQSAPFVPAKQLDELISIVDHACAESATDRQSTAAELEQELVQFVLRKLTSKQLSSHPVALSLGLGACMVGSFMLGATYGSDQQPQIIEVPVPATASRITHDASSGLCKSTTRIEASADDAEEYGEGVMYLDSSDLEMIWDETDQFVGLRFESVQLPADAILRSACIQFESDCSDNGETNLVIRGIASANAKPFEDVAYDISKRNLTDATVLWHPVPWIEGDIGAEQATPDLSSIIQEIRALDGWQSGCPMAFVITGSGRRSAVATDGVGISPELQLSFREIEDAPPFDATPDATPDATRLDTTSLDTGSASAQTVAGRP